MVMALGQKSRNNIFNFFALDTFSLQIMLALIKSKITILVLRGEMSVVVESNWLRGSFQKCTRFGLIIMSDDLSLPIWPVLMRRTSNFEKSNGQYSSEPARMKYSTFKKQIETRILMQRNHIFGNESIFVFVATCFYHRVGLDILKRLFHIVYSLVYSFSIHAKNPLIIP